MGGQQTQNLRSCSNCSSLLPELEFSAQLQTQKKVYVTFRLFGYCVPLHIGLRLALFQAHWRAFFAQHPQCANRMLLKRHWYYYCGCGKNNLVLNCTRICNNHGLSTWPLFRLPNSGTQQCIYNYKLGSQQPIGKQPVGSHTSSQRWAAQDWSFQARATSVHATPWRRHLFSITLLVHLSRMSIFWKVPTLKVATKDSNFGESFESNVVARELSEYYCCKNVTNRALCILSPQLLQSQRSSWKRCNRLQEHPSNLYSFGAAPLRSHRAMFQAQMILTNWCSRSSCLLRRGDWRDYKEEIGCWGGMRKEIDKLSELGGSILEGLHGWLKPSFGLGMQQ